MTQLPTISDPPDPLVLARAHIEAFLRRPVALITGQVLTTDVPREGVVELPLRPVVSVDSVALSSGDPVPPYSVLGDRIYGLPPFTWVQLIYTHGWRADQVPEPIATIMQALASRIGATPPGVRSERLGGYSVDYGSALGQALSDDEKLLLLPFRVGRNAGTLELGPELSPAVGSPGGLPVTGGTP